MKFYRCLVLVAIIVTVQSLTDEQKAKWKKWNDECQSETGVSTEAINKIRNKEFDAVDDKIKAYSLCFGKKSSLIKASGDVDVENLKTKLRRFVANEDEVNEIVGKCIVKKDSQQETAFQVFKCLKENRPKFTSV